MNLKVRFFWGLVSGAGSVVLKTLLNIALIPVFIYYLGLDQYGLYVLLLGLLEMSFVMDMGFTAAIVKALGTYRTQQQPEKARRFLKLGHLFYAGLSLLVLGVGWLAMPHFVTVFHVPPILQGLARVALLLVLAEGVLTLYSCYYRAVLTAHCLHQWANVGDTIFMLAANGAGLVLLLMGMDLHSVLAVRLLAAVVRTIVLMWQTLRVEPEAFFPRASLHGEDLREMLSLSIHSFIINISIFVSHKIDYFVIGLFLPLSMVGCYEIVFRFVGISLQIVSKLGEGLFPMFTRLLSQDRTSEVRQLFLRTSALNNMVVCLLLLVIVFYYPQLFHRFSVGKIDIRLTLPVLAFAVPIVWSGAMQIPAGYYLFVSGRQRYMSVSSLVTAVCNLTLSLLLVQPLGIVGVAIGTFVPQLIQHQASLIYSACKALAITPKLYFSSVYQPLLLPLLIVWLWLLVWTRLLAQLEANLLFITLAGSSGLCLGSLLWFLRSALPQEKALVMQQVIKPIKQLLTRQRMNPVNG